MSSKATREAYGEALAEFGADENIIVLDCDLSKSTKTDTFKKVYPERFINCGIAEGNMMSVAAGMATTGKTVFASTFAMFAAGRGFEQIRNSIGYPHLNVKIGATHAGLSVGEDGASHQCNEDMGLMTTIPEMVVLCPADAREARGVVKAAIAHNGPVYMRFSRMASEDIYGEDYDFEIGKGSVIKDGKDVTIIATGIMVGFAVAAANELLKDGIDARVVNMASIKPIDKDLVIKCAKETGCIVTAEEHNIIGGLGSAVASVLSTNCPTIMKMVGVEDRFGRSGTVKDVLTTYGLTAENIIEKVKEVIKLK